jgi:4-hydroxy-L-threonine phosphate dehydrogenase PdxA
MNIFITQGHEKGIGLEVFFKSCISLPDSAIKRFHLFAYKNSVYKTLKTLHFPFELNSKNIVISGIEIGVTWVKDKNLSQSFMCLEEAIKRLESDPQNILFTLPTSKDQFPSGINGHTEFFRYHFQKNDIGMFFSCSQKKILLITDHIRLSSVSETITKDLIFSRITQALTYLKKWNIQFKNVFIAGINPHAGEGGLIGEEDSRINLAINKLSGLHSEKFFGPLSGDSLFHLSQSPKDLFVYIYHDQGLAPFKATQGLIGSNISLGLPFLRLSPDHGTSFALFGKNLADYRGCAYALKESLQFLKVLEHG